MTSQGLDRDPLLEFSDVTRSFEGIIALNGVNLKVPKGGIIGVIGPNGAGKTTAFNVTTGAFPVTSGTILFDGKAIQDLPPYRIARCGISRTFQNIRLFRSMTVWEHLLVAMRSKTGGPKLSELVARAVFGGDLISRRRAEEILSVMGLESFRERPATTLAYGQQRRVEIARALASDPKLILLDEPVAGMNADEAQELRQLILRLRSERGLTILLIEHDMPFVMDICDYLYVLDFGVVISEGTPQQVQRDPAVIEAYLGK